MVSAGPRAREHDGALLPHRGELGAAGAAGVVVACPAGGQRVIIDLPAPEFNWVQHPCALLRRQNLARAGPAVLASPQEDVLRVVAWRGPVGVFCVHPGTR
jgi:hypothetical protein